MIEVRNVAKQFQTPGGPFFALSDVSLSVKSGEIFGIIGRSGAGKSTLLRILNLLERPTTGEVLIEGRDITRLDGPGLRRLRLQIGMVFQHFNLLSSRTVYDNVRLPLRIAGGLTAVQESQRVAEALDLVGLSDQARKYPRQLSGGQRQRVGIARALADRPRLLLCDEATSALDPETTQSILALLNDINRRLKLTIVLITHGMDVIRAIADRVAVLDHGRIVERGDVMDVFLRPKHPTTRALLAESGVETQGDVATLVYPGLGGIPLGGTPLGGSSLGRIPLATSRLWRLTYQGAAVATPVLTTAAREHGLDITILQGSIGHIKAEPYAQLTVSLSDDDDARLRPFLDSLARHDVHCERLS